MKVAVVGATGLVGRKMIELLKEMCFPVTELIPVASHKSQNLTIEFNGKNCKVLSIEEAIIRKPHIALFSAGSEVSINYAPAFAAQGTYVIDNSSAWRMDTKVKLVVPEINADILTSEDKIIANPNCSTIQMVMVLGALHKVFKIKRLIVSTYQAVTGSGYKAVEQLKSERANIAGSKFYPHPIDLNVIPHCDVFLDNGYTKEEIKLVNETRKILADETIMVSATAARVPVVGGHSESVNVEFEKDFSIEQVYQILKNSKGVCVYDDIENNIYPMPIVSYDKNDVFVGRIRKDLSNPKALNMWIVADNIRKGAATNAVQIAMYIQKFIKQ